GKDFKPGGQKSSVGPALSRRLETAKEALAFVTLAGLVMVVPGLVIPTFSKIFVDDVLVDHRTSWAKPLLVGIAITAVLKAVLTWLQRSYLRRLQAQMSLTTSSRYLWH